MFGPKAMEQTYRCVKCGKEFTRYMDLYKHKVEKKHMSAKLKRKPKGE